MMLRPRSLGVSARLAQILRAEAQTFLWVKGTIFGRDVVPEVCSTKAISSGPGAPLAAGVLAGAAPVSRLKRPAPSAGCGRKVKMATPSLLAISITDEALPSSTITALAFKSLR